MQTKHCTMCDSTLPINFFYKTKYRRTDGTRVFSGYCILCTRRNSEERKNRKRKAKPSNASRSQSVIRGRTKRDATKFINCPEWNDPLFIAYETKYAELISKSDTKSQMDAMLTALAECSQHTPITTH